MRSIAPVSLAFVLTFVYPPLSVASTYVVDPSGGGDFDAIGHAVHEAANGDTIELAAATYTGFHNHDLNVSGKALTIKSQSGDPTACIIDCEGSAAYPHYFIAIEKSPWEEAFVIEGISVTGSYSSSVSGLPMPAIRLLETGPLVLRSCRLYENEAPVGGGRYPSVAIALNTPGLTFEDCLVWGNYGGPAIDGSFCFVQIIRSTITGNHSPGITGGVSLNDGGVYAESSILWGNCGEMPPAGYHHADVGLIGTTSMEFHCSVVKYIQYGNFYFHDCIFKDPIFCDPADCQSGPTGDGVYTVSRDSPCLPDNNSCGAQIGALGEGCVIVPTAAATWGLVKARFRE